MSVPSDSFSTVFDPDSYDGSQPFTVLGSGALGGRAEGLALLRSEVLPHLGPEEFPGFEIGVPKLVVLTTEVFEGFLAENDLLEVTTSGRSDREIAGAFLEAELPARHADALRILVDKLRRPLAVRSSSTLEQEIGLPFAGVYKTKLIPNSEEKVEQRFLHLCQAIKLVYASAFFARANAHAVRVGRAPGSDRLAIVVQEVVGQELGDCFYPTISGSASSYNYYPLSGSSPDDGAVSLALGLGKTIVDGGRCWVYCPALPHRPPPFLGTAGLLKSSQVRFWAIDLKKQVHASPSRDDEFLTRLGLDTAQADGSLRHIASTYDAQSDRLTPGAEGGGPKVLNFAPLLGSPDLRWNDLLPRLLELAEKAFETSVEMEFAMTLDPAGREPARLGIVQARPAAMVHEQVDLEEGELEGPELLLTSRSAMGNGRVEGVSDVVFVKPKDLDPVHTRLMAVEVGQFDRTLREAKRPYLLIGVGRWGTQDPWMGIPVAWDQISGAKVIVETTLPQLSPEPSQGAHFFQSMVASGVLYLSTRHDDEPGIDWGWLDRQETVAESQHVKHVRAARPLTIAVDGRTGRGAVKTAD